MTGRGIDQVMPHRNDPRLYEPYVQTAVRYVQLAERANGRIQRPVDFDYIWGDALDELTRVRPDVRIINLETAVTQSGDYWESKGIHYRMHPKNVPCLTAARIDCCALANNHVLDWGPAGLIETLQTLGRANVKTPGAGQNRSEAAAPVEIEVSGKGRALVFAYGSGSSGIPASWAATQDRPGVHLLADLSGDTVRTVAAQVRAVKQPGDIVVASIHWGGNWGYDVPRDQREFAHRLVDEAGVDLIHGHSSHHPKGLEVYRDRLVLYGCGDFINDYEGIGGHERFRAELSLMYFVRLDSMTGKLIGVELTPTRMAKFRVHRASRVEGEWLREAVSRASRKFGTRLEWEKTGRLGLRW